MFMGSGSGVEQGGFPAIGISHQGHPYHMIPLGRQPFHHGVKSLLLILKSFRQRPEILSRIRLPGFFLADHLNPARLFPPQRYFISKYLILNGIL